MKTKIMSAFWNFKAITCQHYQNNRSCTQNFFWYHRYEKSILCTRYMCFNKYMCGYYFLLPLMCVYFYLQNLFWKAMSISGESKCFTCCFWSVGNGFFYYRCFIKSYSYNNCIISGKLNLEHLCLINIHEIFTSYLTKNHLTYFQLHHPQL